MKFRLLEHGCGNRTWVEGTPIEPPFCERCRCDGLWIEKYTFYTRSNGPGLHPTQIGPDAARSHCLTCGEVAVRAELQEGTHTSTPATNFWCANDHTWIEVTHDRHPPQLSQGMEGQNV